MTSKELYNVLKEKVKSLKKYDEEVYREFLENESVTKNDCIMLVKKDYKVLPLIYELKNEYFDIDLLNSFFYLKLMGRNTLDLLDYDFLSFEMLQIIVSYLNELLKGVYFKDTVSSSSIYTTRKEIVKKIINHKNGGREILKDMILQSENFQDFFKDELINNNYCDSEILTLFNTTDYDVNKLILLSEHLTSDVISQKLDKWGKTWKNVSLDTLNLFAINDKTLEDSLIKLINLVNVNRPFSFLTQGIYKTEILISILDNKNCTDKVIDKMANNKIDQKTVKKIYQNGAYNKKIKIKIISASDKLDKADIDYFIDLNPTKDEALTLIKKTIKLTDIEAINTIINYLEQKKDNDVTEEIINFLFEQKTINDDNEIQSEVRKIIEKMIDNATEEKELVHILNNSLFFSEDEQFLAKVVASPLAMNKVKHALSKNLLDLKTTYKMKNDDIQVLKCHKYLNIIEQKFQRNMFTIEEEENATEILRRNVEDGLSTLIFGPSGVGKSSRVYRVDPTATTIILKDGMLPEEVIGGKEPNGEVGKEYPPAWYVSLCKKCKDESNRNHILFIDEFTNVSDYTKNLVWDVIGSRRVNGKEKWKLPDNAVIVVAGNRKEESTAVRSDIKGGIVPAPLHNKIDYILEIPFDLKEWSEWALETDPDTKKNRIHPIVYSFCVAHADDVMFTEYDPENVTEPFLSPRKWETLSKAIYKAYERGEKHHMSDVRLRGIIGSSKITDAFKAHYERIPLDIEKIRNGSYVPGDFESIDDKLYALGMIILDDTLEEVEVESFICDVLETEEYLEIYRVMKNIRKNALKVA